jgi:hypothetical protein
MQAASWASSTTAEGCAEVTPTAVSTEPLSKMTGKSAPPKSPRAFDSDAMTALLTVASASAKDMSVSSWLEVQDQVATGQGRDELDASPWRPRGSRPSDADADLLLRGRRLVHALVRRVPEHAVADGDRQGCGLGDVDDTFRDELAVRTVRDIGSRHAEQRRAEQVALAGVTAAPGASVRVSPSCTNVVMPTTAATATGSAYGATAARLTTGSLREAGSEGHHRSGGQECERLFHAMDLSGLEEAALSKRSKAGARIASRRPAHRCAGASRRIRRRGS